MNKVKFLAFADIHHYPGVFFTDARARLQKIIKRAQDANVDFIVSLGDFCHSSITFKDFISDSENSPIKIYHVMGNHDTDGSPLAAVLRDYKMPSEYYYFDHSNFRFIVIDTNYYKHEGGFTHFEFRNYFDFPKTREILPPEQLKWLDETIQSSPYPCILLSHSSLERENNAVQNRQEVFDIIKKHNANGRKVFMSLNGHHHRDGLRIVDNVAYFDVNSASFDWCSLEHNFFPKELLQQYELADHQVIFTEPLSAIVTVSEDATIEIEGCKADFYMGITREMTPNPATDPCGRLCTAEVLSAKFRLL